MRTPGAANWTAEREDQLRELWATGESASKIAAIMGEGLTRNSIIGKASRLGLDHRRSPILPRLEPGEARARRNELQRQRRANAPKQPKVRKPALPRRAKKVIVPRRVVYQPDTGASDAELVQGWLAMNGPRRFERGASGDEMAMRSYLHARGHETTYRQGKLYLIGRGRPRLLTYKDLVAFVDEIRVSEGLQRIAA
jgi:hypothetical protein